MEALIAPELLRHFDMDVKIAVASCISELTRITVPSPPYKAEVMKEFFELVVMALGRLSSTNDCCYSKAVSILCTLANVRSCVVMLDLEMDDLVLELFQLLLHSIESKPNHSLLPYMERVMVLLIDENDDVPMDLLSVLLTSVKKDSKDVSPFSYILAVRVLAKCSTEIKPYLAKAVRSAGTDFGDYAGVVASLCRDATPGENMVVKELASDAACPAEVGRLLVGPSKLMENNSTAQNDDHYISKKRKCNQMYPSLIIDKATSKKDDGPLKDGNSRREQTSGQIEVQKGFDLTTISQVKNVNATKDAPEHNQSFTAPAKRERKPNSLFKPKGGYNRIWSTGESQSPKISCREKGERKRSYLLEKTLSSSEHIASRVKEAQTFNASALESHGSPDENRCGKGALKKKGYIVAQDDPEQKEELYSAAMADKNQNRGEITIPENSEETLAIEALLELKELASPLTHKALIPEAHFGEAFTSEDKRKSCSSMEEEWLSNNASAMTCMAEDFSEILVGHKIRVWWPMDEQFYEGCIASFDHSTKKHKVIYDDGDIEILNLKDELWHFVKENTVRDGQKMLQGSSTSSDMFYSFSSSTKKQKHCDDKQAADVSITEHVISPNHKKQKAIKRKVKSKVVNNVSPRKTAIERTVSKTSKTQCSTNPWERPKIVGGADIGELGVQNDILKASGTE